MVEVEGMDLAVVAYLQMMVITGGNVSGYILDNAQDFGCQKCGKPELELFFTSNVLVDTQKNPRLIAFLYDGQATTKTY